MQLMSHVLKTNKRESVVVVVFFRVSFVRDYVCTKDKQHRERRNGRIYTNNKRVLKRLT